MNAFACLRTSTTPPHPNCVQRPSSPFTPLPPVQNCCCPTPQFPNPAAHLSRMLSGFVFISVNLRFHKNVDSPIPPFPPVQKSQTSHLLSPKTPVIPRFPPNPTSFPRPLPILHFELSTLDFFTSHQNVDSTSRLSLQKNKYGSSFSGLCALGVFVVKFGFSSDQNVDSPLPPFPPVQKPPTSHFFSSKTPAIPPFPPNPTWLSLQKNNSTFGPARGLREKRVVFVVKLGFSSAQKCRLSLSSVSSFSKIPCALPVLGHWVQCPPARKNARCKRRASE
jgi:hypothetical protein